MVLHEQVEVTHPREGLIEVDCDMAPLLVALWTWDIDTTMSCQDSNGWVWIEFTSTYDVEKFLNIIGRHLEPPTSWWRQQPKLFESRWPLAPLKLRDFKGTDRQSNPSPP